MKVRITTRVIRLVSLSSYDIVLRGALLGKETPEDIAISDVRIARIGAALPAPARLFRETVK
ncbi:hypothetical protein [Rhizobium sp. FKY42]|uniref:hypothetical protein n=1 Tax=Rhizobium sp. FKY42 TaxID=2562310 RepID=UPI0010BFA909|nr:hypothetical protein [Rhizobium sp. FKY42]